MEEGRGVVKPLTVVRAVVLGVAAVAVGLAVVAGSLAGQPVISGNAAGPTPICGTLTTATWDANGNPFNLCASGATIPFGVTITIDGSKGQVQVHSAGGGLNVNGGVLNTINTTSAFNVTFDASPSTTPGAWSGLSFTADGSANKGSGTLANVNLSYASTGITVNSGATSLTGGWGVSLTNVAIDHTSSHGLYVTYTPVTVSGGSFTNIGASGVTFYGSTSAHKLNVDSSTFTTVNNSAIYASGVNGAPMTVTGNTVSSAGTYSSGYPAIETDGSDTLTLSGNQVTGSSLGSDTAHTKNPAIMMSNDAVNLANVTGQPSVFGNHGSGNAIDAMQLNGITVKSDFSWLTPHPNTSAASPLGYLMSTDLNVAPGATMSVAANDVIKASSGIIRLNGAHLVVSGTTGNQAVFTSIKDSSFDTSKNLPSTCPSSLASTCVAAASDWGGVSVNTTLGTAGDASLAFGTIRYAGTGITINSGATSLAGGFGLALNTVGIDHTSSHGVNATYTAISVSGGTFSSIGAAGVNFYGSAAAQKLNVDTSTFTSSGYYAIYAYVAAGIPTTITNNTIGGAGTYSTGYPAIEVDNADTLTLSGNQVTGSSLGSDTNHTKNPVILLNNVTVNLGLVTGQPSVFGNHGSGNALDAVQLSGVTVKNDFSWFTPHPNATAASPLGYLMAGELNVSPNTTMSVAANDVIKASYGTIHLNGAHLVVSGTAGNQAIFTSIKDSSFDGSKNLPSTCPSSLASVCVPGPGDWGGVSVVTASGTAGDASLAFAAIRYASVGITINSGAASLAGGWGLTASNVAIDHTSGNGITANYTAASVSAGTFSAIGTNGISFNGNATGQKLTLDGNSFTTVNDSAIYAYAATGIPVVITNETISGVGTYSSGYPAIEVDYSDTVTLSGNTVTGSSLGSSGSVKNPVILLTGDTVNLGAVTGQPSVFGNNGSGNGLDAVQLNSVTVRNSFAWQTPHPNASAAMPLGYLVTNTLTLSPNQTMTVAADDVVKILSGGIAVSGAHLVVNGTLGHQAVFTSMRDGSFDAAHNVPSTCPSSIVTGCVATSSDWNGISVTQGTAGGIPYLGDVSMTQATIRYGSNGITINSGATSLTGGWGAMLSGVTIDHTSSSGVVATYTPLTISSSTLTNIGGVGVSFYGSDRTKHKLTVDNVTLSTVGQAAIYAYAAAGIPVVISSNTVSAAATNNSGYAAIGADNTDVLTLSNNRVTGSSLGSNGTKNPAIELSSDIVNLGNMIGQPSVYGNTGNGNALDLIQMSSLTVKNSFNWQTPHVNANATDALGYLVTGDLIVNPNQTMTVAADDVIKVYGGSIRLYGAHLVVNGTTGHQAVFTSIRDGSFDAARNVPSTCPSSIVSDCVAGAGNWTGITVTAGTDNGIPYLGDAAIVQGAIRFAGTAVSINDGATSLAGGWGLTLANVTIDHMTGDGVNSSTTPTSVTGSSISTVGSTGVHVYASTPAQKLRVDGTSFNTSGYHAILMQAVSGVPIALTNNTIVAAGTTTTYGSAAIEVSGADNLALNGNQVSGSSTGQNGTKNPAIRLISDTVNLGNVTGQPSVYNNTGRGNGLDAFELNGVYDLGSFAWITPRANSADTDPLGYLINSGDLSVGPNATLTFAANDVVKAVGGGIKLNGAHLVDTAGGAVFTSIRDGSVDASKNVLMACPSALVALCVPQPGEWGGITIGQGTVGGVPVQGDGMIVGATIRYAGNGVTISSSSTALPGGVGLQMSKSVVLDSSTQGVAVGSGASATISTSRFTNNGGSNSGAFAISANGPVAVDCTSIHGNSQGLYSGVAGNSIMQSDLFGNTGTNRYDVFAYYPTVATSNWWGHDTAPAASQIGGSPGTVDSSNFLTSQAPTATITFSSDNVNANGALGKGTLTVTLSFSRKMDTSVQPVVTIDPGAHPVVGDWRPDGKTWVGTYVMTSSTTSAGQNTVTVTAARSCVPEPTTNQMVQQQKTFTADFGSATATTNAATLVSDQGATLNGTVNPNGWNTTAYFEYGTTSGSYPSTTANQNAGNGTSPMAFQQAVTGLTPFTTYYYKMVGSTANGAAEGNEQTFVTPSILHFPALMNNAFGNPGYTTTIYLQNKSGAALAAGAITITYYDQNGAGVGVGDSSPALADGAVWVIPQSNGHSFASGGAGSGRVNTSVALVAFVNQEIPGGDGSGYSALPDPQTGSTVYAPTILNNAYGGYTTSLGITNTGTGSTTVSVTYHQLDGTAIAGPSKSLAPNAFWGLYQGEAGTPLTAGFAGTATVSTNPASSLAVIVNEINSQNGQFLTYTASNAGAKTLYAPVILNNAYGGYSTAIGLQNLGSGMAHVTVTYTGAPGACTVTGPFCEVFTMNAGGSTGLYNGGGSGNASLANGFAGSAVISSDQPLISIVNQVKGGANFGTSYNTFAGGVPTVNLPLVENNYNGFSTGVGIENVGTGSATVTIVYRNADTGAVVGNGVTLTLLPGQYAGVYQGPGGDGGVPAGTRATARLTITNPGGGGKLAVIANQQSATSFMSYSGQ